MSMSIIMTTTMRSMNINHDMITKNMNITMTMTTIMRSMTKTAPAAVMITIIITIIMQMRYLQAGARRHLISLQKSRLRKC